LIVKTEMVCPRCGGVLELVEVEKEGGALYLGCPRCLCYVALFSSIARRYINRRAMRFDWRLMMRDAYRSYLDLIHSTCQRRR
jgi:hypothetical protein